MDSPIAILFLIVFIAIIVLVLLSDIKNRRKTVINQQENQSCPDTQKKESIATTYVTGSFKCPTCGAATVGNKITSSICTYCNSPIPELSLALDKARDLQEKENQRKYEHERMQLLREQELEHEQFKERAQIRKDRAAKRNNISLIITLLICSLPLIIYLIYFVTRSK